MLKAKKSVGAIVGGAKRGREVKKRGKMGEVERDKKEVQLGVGEMGAFPRAEDEGEDNKSNIMGMFMEMMNSQGKTERSEMEAVGESERILYSLGIYSEEEQGAMKGSERSGPVTKKQKMAKGNAEVVISSNMRSNGKIEEDLRKEKAEFQSGKIEELLSNNSLKDIMKMIEGGEKKNKIPAHPLIKSNSEYVGEIERKEKSLKGVVPRLPRRNLKPLDFSQLRQEPQSEKGAEEVEERQRIGMNRRVRNAFADLVAQAYQRASIEVQGVGKGSEENSEVETGGIMDEEMERGIERAVRMASEDKADKIYTMWTSDGRRVNRQVGKERASEMKRESGDSCRYCGKRFKAQTKKQSHEQKCSSRLEAMLYSQPDVEKSESTSSVGIGIGIGSGSQLKTKPKRKPTVKVTAKNKKVDKLRAPMVSSDGTMSLSEGSELNNFHRQSSMLNIYALSDSGSHQPKPVPPRLGLPSKSTAKPVDFVGLPLPACGPSKLRSVTVPHAGIKGALNSEPSMYPAEAVAFPQKCLTPTVSCYASTYSPDVLLHTDLSQLPENSLVAKPPPSQLSRKPSASFSRISTSPFAAPICLSPKEHGSSSTITLPHDDMSDHENNNNNDPPLSFTPSSKPINPLSLQMPSVAPISAFSPAQKPSSSKPINLSALATPHPIDLSAIPNSLSLSSSHPLNPPLSSIFNPDFPSLNLNLLSQPSLDPSNSISFNSNHIQNQLHPQISNPNPNPNPNLNSNPNLNLSLNPNFIPYSIPPAPPTDLSDLSNLLLLTSTNPSLYPSFNDWPVYDENMDKELEKLFNFD